MGERYRKIAIVLFAASHPGALVLWMTGHPLAGIAVLAAANLGVWIPTVTPNHQWFGRTVTTFATSGGEVWLTIDDGPDRDDTGAVLEVLARFDAKATFFLVGKRAEAFPDEVRAIRRAGHSVGNHTHHHFAAWFWALPGRVLRAEVRSCEVTLENILGERTALFRPPVGMKNPLLQGVLDRAELVHIGWSAAGRDGVSRDAERVLRRIRPRLRPGAIIVVHQGGRDRGDRLLAPVVLEGLFEELAKRGLRCVIPPPETYLAGGCRKTAR